MYVLYKAENWHALSGVSHEQYFSKNYFLNICQCAFKSNFKADIPNYITKRNDRPRKQGGALLSLCVMISNSISSTLASQ